MYDLIIVGSGYAGSVLAARLAPKAKVLLVERGKWWRPGDFPESLFGLARTYLTKRNPLGLWAMRIGEGTGNAFASAFGGSSSVNYGITSRPDPHAFEGWPVTEGALDPYFARALDVLKPTANPDADALGDKQLLDRLEPGARVDLENTIDWDSCTQCGRCVPGCNLGAKRSLDQTYLARALAAGVALRLETEVVGWRAREGGGYDVQLRASGGGAVSTIATARLVIAAGTLGTLDLLHAQRDAFPLGPRFGQRMSMNGDGLAFIYNIDDTLSSHSWAPISTSVRLRFTDDAGRKRTLMAMSGRVPRAIMNLAATALAVGAEALVDRAADPRPSLLERARKAKRRLTDLAPIVTGGGAFSHSFMYKLDGQDSDAGVARWVNGRAVIDWPDYLEDPINRFADGKLREWAQRTGGRVVPNVASLPFPGMRSFSVHPLGGCRMGSTIEEGVVDSYGRVFAPGGGFYEGLRVIDGSVVPRSLGVPPSLTIAAIAERAAEHLAAEMAA